MVNLKKHGNLTCISRFFLLRVHFIVWNLVSSYILMHAVIGMLNEISGVTSILNLHCMYDIPHPPVEQFEHGQKVIYHSECH